MVYLWRAVDAEGEILDVLVQSKRDKHAALKSCASCCRNTVSFPIALTTCGRTALLPVTSGSRNTMSVVGGRTIEGELASANPRRERKMQDIKPRISPTNSSQPMQPSTIPSTSNVT